MNEIQEKVLRLFEKGGNQPTMNTIVSVSKFKRSVGEKEFMKALCADENKDEEFDKRLDKIMVKYWWILLEPDTIAEIMNSKFSRWHLKQIRADRDN